MPCFLIAEINEKILDWGLITNLDHETKHLNIAGFTPSYAEVVTPHHIVQLRQLSTKPLLLPEEWIQMARANDLLLTKASLPFASTDTLHFLSKENATSWCSDKVKALAKNDYTPLLEWLTADENATEHAIVVPLAIFPVIAALKSIHKLDPYLAMHYFQQLQPLLPTLSKSIQLEICQIRTGWNREGHLPDMSISSEAERYIRLERKLHRQYREH